MVKISRRKRSLSNRERRQQGPFRGSKNKSRAAHDVKATAYTKALERIINGDDYEKALVDADAEWKAYLDEHIWD